MSNDVIQFKAISTKNHIAQSSGEAHHWVHMTRQVMSRLIIVGTICLFSTSICIGQSSPEQGEQQQMMPVATQWTLDAAGPFQRAGIKAVMLLYCPASGMKGTAFSIDAGYVVTNNHVVVGCTVDQLEGLSSLGKNVKFTKMAVDAIVDLALLRPSAPLPERLKLGSVDKIPVGVGISTWGYPLSFNGPTPILSTGVLAGFMEGRKRTKKSKASRS